MSSNLKDAPICQPGNPDDMEDMITKVEVEMLRLGINHSSDRFQRYVYTLHKARGFTPVNYRQAWFSLSAEQFEAMFSTLSKIGTFDLS